MAIARWEPVSRLHVHYQDNGEAVLVGGLAVDASGRVHFQYERSWIESNCAGTGSTRNALARWIASRTSATAPWARSPIGR